MRRSSRGGVPVLSRPISKPQLRSDSASACVGGSPARPAGRCSSPTCTSPFRNVPVVTTRVVHVTTSPSSNSSPRTTPCSTTTRPARRKSQVRLGSAESASRTQPAVLPLVRLRARRPHRRTAAAIEQLELNAGRIDRAAHQAAERIDFADEMPLRRAADRRIAGHERNRLGRERAEPNPAPHTSRRPRGLDPRMAGADHDDVKVVGIDITAVPVEASSTRFGCAETRTPTSPATTQNPPHRIEKYARADRRPCGRR